MRKESLSIEEFLPVCSGCGEKISGIGYEIDGEFYCEDCMNEYRIDGFKVGDENRDTAWEEANRGDYD